MGVCVHLCTSVSCVTLLVCNTGGNQLDCSGVRKASSVVDKWSNWALFWVQKNIQQWNAGTLDQSQCRERRFMQAEHGICWSLPWKGQILSLEFSFISIFEVAHYSFLLFFSFYHLVPIYLLLSLVPPFFASLYAKLLFLFELVFLRKRGMWALWWKNK